MNCDEKYVVLWNFSLLRLSLFHSYSRFSTPFPLVETSCFEGPESKNSRPGPRRKNLGSEGLEKRFALCRDRSTRFSVRSVLSSFFFHARLTIHVSALHFAIFCSPSLFDQIRWQA